MDKKIMRKDFMKVGFFGIIALIIAPAIKTLGIKKKDSYKEARHYKRLEG